MKKIIGLVLIAAMAICGSLAFTACNKSTQIKVGVQAGTTGEYFVKGDADWGFDGFTNIECVGFTTGSLAIQDMLNGNLSYVVIDEAPANKLAASIEGIKVVNVQLTEEEYAFGVNKDDAALLASVNSLLSTIKANGTYDEIINKYYNDTDSIEGVTSGTYNASANQLVVATSANFPPFEYKIGNKFAGIDMEIAKLIADSIGAELVVMDMDFDGVVTSVGSNGVDIAMAALTVNDTRKLSVNFSDTYFLASQVVICKADDTTFDGLTTAEAVIAKLKSL